MQKKYDDNAQTLSTFVESENQNEKKISHLSL